MTKYSIDKVRAQVRVTEVSKRLTLGKSYEWSEWTQPIAQQIGERVHFGVGKAVRAYDSEQRKGVREPQG